MVPSMVGALLNNIPTLWAVPLAGFIGAVTYNLSTFCASDPPAVPTFTAQDVIDLLNPYNPIPYSDAQEKFQQLVGAYAWYQVCKCDSVATPAPPTPPSAPTGMPSINPPSVAPSYPTGQPCSTFEYVATATSGMSNVYGPLTPIPDGATEIQLSGTWDRTALTSGIRVFGIWWGTAGWASYPTTSQSLSIPDFYIDTSGVHTDPRQAIPPGITHYWTVFGGNPSTFSPSPVSVDAFVNWYCGSSGSGGGGDVPQPCPTDPFVLAILEQILALTTIIQRQAAPFSYIASTAHAGLTGRGSISVQGLLGAKIEVTAMGSITGEELGDPDVLWDAGWVNWGSADGVSSRQFITNAEMLTLPSLAGQYTEIHYSLEPGVTITITELEREP